MLRIPSRLLLTLLAASLLSGCGGWRDQGRPPRTDDAITIKPQASLVATKALMKQSQQGLKAVMDDEFKQFGQMLRGPACKEAIDAFMNKRKPDFSKL